MTSSRRVSVGARSALAGLAVLSLAATACASPSTTPSPASSLAIFSPRPSVPPSSPVQPSASASAAASATASAAASPSGLLAECTTVATGLLNPRGIAIASDGTVYVAEAGTGGTEPDYATAPVGSPAASIPAESAAASMAAASPVASTSPGASGSPAPAGLHGETGQITKIAPDGTPSVFATGLTSYDFMGQIVGPAGVVVGKDGKIFVSIGGPGPGTGQFVPAGNADSVVSVDSTGTVTPLANIGQYERDNNPDPNQVDSNVGGMAMGTDGLLYVADSGGNDLYSVNPDTGELKLVTVFAGLPSVGGAPNPARGNKPEVDPVPTSVVADPKGGVYVGFLAGAALWGVPDSAKVVHVATDGRTEDAVTGLNMVTGVAEESGSIFASELSTNFTATPPDPGELSMATPGSAPQTLLTGLMLPYGIAIAPDGKSIDIVINSTGPAGTPPNGQIINCPLPEVPGTPATPAASVPASASPAVSSSPAVSAAPSATPTTAPTSTPTKSAPPTAAPSLPASLPATSPSLAPATL